MWCSKLVDVKPNAVWAGLIDTFMLEGVGEHEVVRKVQSGHKAARAEVIASLPNRAPSAILSINERRIDQPV